MSRWVGTPIVMTEEEKKFSRRFWWSVFGFFFIGGLAIKFMPVWLLGVLMVFVVAIVAMIAIAAGVKQGNGD